MEKLKFSIVACAYGNNWQFENFLCTAISQAHNSFEIIIVDNATPNKKIQDICLMNRRKKSKVKYFRIEPEQKKCKNITQGINLAARKARGEYLVIVADPNVLLSLNFLTAMDAIIDNDTLVLLDMTTNSRLSPTGSYEDEYSILVPEVMSEMNENLLKQMGWPADPLSLVLIPGKHRMAPAHLTYDCVVTGLSKENYFKSGGYDENDVSWGIYHEVFIRRLSESLGVKFIGGVRVIHQYHRVLKDNPF
jgi:glycosyltransferase involved in cell wall biosynthesis